MKPPIEVLREIVKTHSAKVLYFEPKKPPVPESLEVVSLITEAEMDYPPPELKAYAKERLLVDMTTANVIVKVYDAMRADLRTKVDALMQTRKGFLAVAKMSWSCVK